MVTKDLANPWTWGIAVVTSVFGALGVFGPVWSFIAATAGSWFSGITVFASFIYPCLSGTCEGFASRLTLFAAIVFVSIVSVRIGRRAHRRFL